MKAGKLTGVETTAQKNERARFDRMVAKVVRLIERGEAEPETGAEALAVLMSWYEATGTAYDRMLPGWMRIRSNEK